MARRNGFILGTALAFAAMLQPAAAGPAMLFEAGTGNVIYAEDVDQVWHPASLTKLMTAYVAFKALKEGRLKPDQRLTVSQAGFKVQPSKLGLKVGDTITVDLALKAVVVKSANDMAVTVAEALGGSEAGFAELMNAEAKRLGMKKTRYDNPHGLPDPQQVTSVRDLAILTQALIRDFPDQAYLFAMPSAKVGDRDIESHNTLLKTYEGADGMKTGFICDSGYNIVASATRDGRRLVAIVLGEPSSAVRNVRAAAMLDYGFQNYLWKTLFGAQTIETVEGAPTDTNSALSLRKEVSSCVAHDAAKTKAEARAKARAEKRAAAKAKTGKPGETKDNAAAGKTDAKAKAADAKAKAEPAAVTTPTTPAKKKVKLKPTAAAETPAAPVAN